MKPRNLLALYLWRITQTQTIGNTLLWPIVITGVYYPYIRPVLREWGLIQGQEVFLGMVYTFLMLFGAISLFALLYDWSKFWKNQAYTRYKKDPAYEKFWLPLARAINKKERDPDLEEGIKLMEEWIEK